MLVSIFKKYKIELAVFFTATLIRFIYAITMQVFYGSHAFISFSDANMYLNIAHNLVHYHIFSEGTASSFLLPDPLRTPGYPVFLALFIWLKSPLLVVVLVQDILVGFMAVMAYRLGVKIFESRSVGIAAGIMFSFEPMSIYWNTMLMSDTLASFLFLFSVYLFASKRYYVSAFVMGLAALTRPMNLYLFPLFLVMAAYQHRNRKRILLMVCVFSLTIFPWMLRNKIQFNTWELSSDGWYALHVFTSKAFSDIENVPYARPPLIPERYSRYPNDVDRLYYADFLNVPFYKKQLVDLISRYPFDFAKFHLISAIRGFDNHDYGYIVRYVLLAKVPRFNAMVAHALIAVGQGAWMVVYGFLIFGFFVKGKRAWQFFLVSFYVVNNFLTGYISTVPNGGGRYGLPFLPLTLMLASYGFMCIYDRLKIRKTGGF